MMPTRRNFYRSLVVLCVAVAVIAVAGGLSAALSEEEPYIPLRLAWGTFDPLREPPEQMLPIDLKSSATYSDGAGYYIIQFRGPIHESDKEAVTALGVELFDYVPDFGFVARMDAGAADAVRALDQVRWVGTLQPAFRIEPSLVAGQAQPDRSGSQELIVVVFRGEDVAGVAGQLEAMGGTVLDMTATHWKGKILVRFNTDRAADVASLPGVRWVELEPTWQVHNGVATGLTGVEDVWDSHGLYGSGQVVAVADSGFDQGSTSVGNMHVDFEDGGSGSRVLAIYDVSGDGNVADNSNGHGTHVAGTVLGNGLSTNNGSTGSNPATHTYAGTDAGAAPETNLVFQAAYSTGMPVTSLIFPSDLNTLFGQARNAGAHIHTNSWGASVAGAYDSYSRDVDEFTWDYKDFVILFSAGNDGIDANSDGVVDLTSMGRPGTAKNCITVGASENNRPSELYIYNPSDFPVAPINGDYTADDPSGMAAFSSRGYALDGRVKPDIVAPGTAIFSTCAYPQCLTADDHVYKQGTSMSTPHVAGAAALAREYFVTYETYTSTSALVKATLANGATSLYPGQYGMTATQEITLTRPSPQEGWGRLNLEASLFPVAPRRTWYWDSSSVMTSSLNFLSTDDVVSYTFEVTETVPLSITLAWADYPGSPLVNGGLVNDLDLKVVGPGGTTYYPNQAQQAPLYYLSYDDGLANNATYSNSVGREWAVRFAPGHYPATISKAWFRLYETASTEFSFDVYVQDDDGSGGTPGTVLGSTTITVTAGPGLFTQEVDLSTCASGSPVTITEGDFYIVFHLLEAQNPWMAFDTDTPIDGRSWLGYNGGSWTQQTDRDYMITAAFTHTATSQDRVNNLVGIDIASPSTGVYTVAVSGYNVPFGPQPYALVVSGVGRPLGTETATRTIPSTGTYKFGNTGVTIEFTDENVDAVAVTVHRDQYHASANVSVKRYYSIASIGGTGVFTANVVFSYEQAEFDASGIADESTLDAWRRSGGSWESVTSAVDTASNVVTVTGVTAFSDWTLSDQNPTAVALTGFEAIPTEGSILVTWETAMEIDNVGFNLYRGETFDGPYVKLNDFLIPSQSPGSPIGAEYDWLDESVEPGLIYYYRLEDVEVGGKSTFHGPISASAEAPTVISVTGIKAQRAAFAVGVPAGLFLVSVVGLTLVKRGRRRI